MIGVHVSPASVAAAHTKPVTAHLTKRRLSTYVSGCRSPGRLPRGWHRPPTNTASPPTTGTSFFCALQTRPNDGAVPGQHRQCTLKAASCIAAGNLQRPAIPRGNAAGNRGRDRLLRLRIGRYSRTGACSVRFRCRAGRCRSCAPPKSARTNIRSRSVVHPDLAGRRTATATGPAPPRREPRGQSNQACLTRLFGPPAVGRL